MFCEVELIDIDQKMLLPQMLKRRRERLQRRLSEQSTSRSSEGVYIRDLSLEQVINFSFFFKCHLTDLTNVAAKYLLTCSQDILEVHVRLWRSIPDPLSEEM